MRTEKLSLMLEMYVAVISPSHSRHDIPRLEAMARLGFIYSVFDKTN
jgi:hypothetical protein